MISARSARASRFGGDFVGKAARHDHDHIRLGFVPAPPGRSACSHGARRICCFRCASIRSDSAAGVEAAVHAPAYRTAGPRPTSRRASAPCRRSPSRRRSARQDCARAWRRSAAIRRSASATSRGSARDRRIAPCRPLRATIRRFSRSFEIGRRDDLEARGLDHAHQRARREMIEMLVDEPFLDNVVGAEKGDIGRIEHQQAARFQHAPMIRERARRVRRDARWCGRNGRCRSGRFPAPRLRCAPGSVRCAADRRRNRATRSSGSTATSWRVGRAVEKGARETAAIGADIEQRKLASKIGVALQRVERRLGAKAFAVADIAPVGAAGDARPARAARGRCAAGSAPARNGGRDRLSVRASSVRARRRARALSRRQSSQASVHGGRPGTNPVTIFRRSCVNNSLHIPARPA